MVLQKTKIPARGLKRFRFYRRQEHLHTVLLQKTKIPARGLKQKGVRDRAFEVVVFDFFKKPKSPRGD